MVCRVRASQAQYVISENMCGMLIHQVFDVGSTKDGCRRLYFTLCVGEDRNVDLKVR